MRYGELREDRESRTRLPSPRPARLRQADVIRSAASIVKGDALRCELEHTDRHNLEGRD